MKASLRRYANILPCFQSFSGMHLRIIDIVGLWECATLLIGVHGLIGVFYLLLHGGNLFSRATSLKLGSSSLVLKLAQFLPIEAQK